MLCKFKEFFSEMQHCGRLFSYSVGKNMKKEEKRCILFVHLGKYPPALPKGGCMYNVQSLKDLILGLCFVNSIIIRSFADETQTVLRLWQQRI